MDEIRQVWVSSVFSLQSLLGAGAMCLLVLSMGYASFRLLFPLPDFPEKRAMLRGARWGGPVFLAITVGLLAALWLGWRYTSYCVTTLAFGKALAWVLIAVLFLRFDPETTGFFAFGYLLRPNRAESLDEWLHRWPRGRERSEQRWPRVMRLLWPWLMFVPALMWLAIGVWGGWRIDRVFALVAREERFNQELQAALASPRVEEVISMASVSQGPPYPLAIQVQYGTTPAQARELVRALQGMLAQRGDRRAWRIYARPEHGKKLAEADYWPPVPRGETVP